MPYKDEKGHFTSKENAGGPCHHEGGSGAQDNSERENLRKEVEHKLKTEGNTSDVRLMAERRGFKIENGKVVEDLKSQAMADRTTGGSGEAFDDDYEEEFKEKYVPQTKIEKDVEQYISDNWDRLDKNKTVGELAYRVSAMIGKPYPQVLDAVTKSLAARQDENPGNSGDNTFEELKTKKTAIETDGDQTDFDVRLEEALEDGKITQEQYDELGGYDEEFANKSQESSIDKYNRMVGLESQMHSKIDNARKNGQSPQQVLDSVAYDMDIQPDTEEYDRLKNLVMYDTHLNKDTGSYEYNKYNSGSNKQVSGEERKKLQDLSDAFNKAGLENTLKDTWEDYGARMGMTNLIHNDTQVLNPRDWIDYMNGNASAEDIIQRIKDSPYKSVFKWKEPENDRQTIIDYYKQKGKDINPELLDKELKSAVHKDFKEGEQVFDTSYGGKGTPGKIVRKLSMKENLDRAGLNNPLAGDYYEIETEFLGIPSRRIVWAGRLNKGE